jgi:hypothetical protein
LTSTSHHGSRPNCSRPAACTDRVSGMARSMVFPSNETRSPLRYQRYRNGECAERRGP